MKFDSPGAQAFIKNECCIEELKSIKGMPLKPGGMIEQSCTAVPKFTFDIDEGAVFVPDPSRRLVDTDTGNVYVCMNVYYLYYITFYMFYFVYYLFLFN